jgi:ribose-phosphate pyrophosphokinase
MGTAVTKVVNINLSPESSWYEEFRYPAGETQVRFAERDYGLIAGADNFTITARIRNAQDIISLALLNNAIGANKYRTLILPYLPYSRADRAFRDGDCCGLEVFGQLLGSMNFDDVVTLDAHNHECAEFYVPRLIDVKPDLFIEHAIADFARKNNSDRITVVFPDEGSAKRYKISRIASNIGAIGVGTTHCTKRRDPINGALLGFTVPEIPSDLPFIIVDDICDGGGTFVGIMQELLPAHAALYVTHGIFSKGLDPLLPCFQRIYTTDSLCALKHERLTVYDSMLALGKVA